MKEQNASSSEEPSPQVSLSAYLSVEEAARILGVTTRSVSWYIKRGRLSCTQIETSLRRNKFKSGSAQSGARPKSTREHLHNCHRVLLSPNKARWHDETLDYIFLLLRDRQDHPLAKRPPLKLDLDMPPQRQ